MKRTVTIDRVVMTNASLRPEETDAFRVAVAAELAQLIEDRGLPMLAPASSIAVDGPAAASAAGAASAIYDALGKVE